MSNRSLAYLVIVGLRSEGLSLTLPGGRCTTFFYGKIVINTDSCWEAVLVPIFAGSQITLRRL